MFAPAKSTSAPATLLTSTNRFLILEIAKHASTHLWQYFRCDRISRVGLDQLVLEFLELLPLLTEHALGGVHLLSVHQARSPYQLSILATSGFVGRVQLTEWERFKGSVLQNSPPFFLHESNPRGSIIIRLKQFVLGFGDFVYVFAIEKNIFRVFHTVESDSRCV